VTMIAHFWTHIFGNGFALSRLSIGKKIVRRLTVDG